MALHLTFWLLKFKEPVRNISFLFVFFIFFQDIPYLEEKV